MKNIPAFQIQQETSAYLENIISLNDSFDKGFLRIAYHGKNRNNTYIAKETFEKCIPSLAYVPLVANFNLETNQIGAHDARYLSDGRGNQKEMVMTAPLGLVPENPNWHWREIRESDGENHEYLCCEVLLWKRQPIYEKIKKNKITKQSMEIDVHDFAMKDGLCHILNFTFTALCLLETAEPCFHSAALLTYSEQESKGQYSEMVQEFQACFQTEEQDHSISKRYNKEDLTMKNTTGTTMTELDAQSLIKKLETEQLTTEFGIFPRYAVLFYSMEAREIYACDLTDYRLYGFPFMKTGTAIEIDFSGKTRKKLSVSSFTDGEPEESLESFADKVGTPIACKKAKKLEKEFLNNVADLAAENRKLAADQRELARLKELEGKLLQTERESILKNPVYAALANMEEYKKLVQNAASYSPTELQTACDLLLAAHIKKSGQFSLTQTGGKIPCAMDSGTDEKPYGRLFDDSENK